jgi:glycosyltransferase involved in cell wall biosynthesis
LPFPAQRKQLFRHIEMVRKVQVVLVIENNSFPRDRRVRQEALALASAGLGVSVICPRGTTQDTSAFFEVVDGIPVYRYRQPWQGEGQLTYMLEYTWALLCTFSLLIWVWMRHGFDVVHAATPPDLFFLIAAPFKLLGKKFVFDQHDLSPEMFEAKFGQGRFAYRVLLWLERLSYRLADLVIVTNQSFYRIAVERGRVDPANLCVVRNGPDLDKFRPVPPQPNLKRGAAALAVYVGVMNRQDGVDRVIRAAEYIVNVRDRKDVRFALLGTGDCVDELRQLARSSGVEPYVDFTGLLGDKDLLAYLSTADICLVPDPPVKLNQLSTMIKVMEYMCCAKPIVSYDLLETRYSAGAAALYVKDDSASFGDAVLELADNCELRNRLGEAGLERVRTELHWGRSKDILLECYERLYRARALPELSSG